MRMSVIVRVLNSDHFTFYCKGSPEKIAELSKNETVPKDFQEILTHYTKQGFRVIAIAKKNLFINFVKAQKIERELIETELEFLGLIILENRLKIPTTPVIKTLKDANIKTIMCTGDNLLTALSVAHECKMIDDNENVIIVEVDNINEEPKFRYTNVVKEKLIQIEIDRKIEDINEQNNKNFHFILSGKSFSILHEKDKELLKKNYCSWSSLRTYES